MALNFSHRPVFSAHISEENLVSPMRIANGYLVEGGSGRQEKVVAEDCFDYGRDHRSESQHKDILDLLPSDPFGMDISTTFTAITGWLEDLEVDYGWYGAYGGCGACGRCGGGGCEVCKRDGSSQLFAGLNFIWNNALKFQAFSKNMELGCKLSEVGGCCDAACVEEREVGGTSGRGALGSDCSMEDIFSTEDDILGGEASAAVHEKIGEYQEGSGGDGGAPHAALVFALGYLGVRDLLVVETVCKSLCSTVRSDPLLWRSIHIDQPLNEKITDDILLPLTSRAQENLQCLSLVECPRITDEGLKHVLDDNPRLTKLSVPGCTRLSIEGIVTSLKAFKAMGTQGVKHLRIGGLYGVTQKHFEELNVLLGPVDNVQQSAHKPHFYHRGNFYLSCDDDRTIDIEMCPICQNLRLVYDCPAEGCQVKGHPAQVCRACTLCIARCIQCGRCINDSEYEETFCLELLCSDCLKQLRYFHEKQDGKICPPKSSPVHQSSCSLRLSG